MSDIKARTLANSRRLLEDAKLLLEHRREYSAVTLSVLALEEIGKYALITWKKNGTQLHKVKQAAALSVVSAFSCLDELADEHRKNGIVEGKSYVAPEASKWLKVALTALDGNLDKLKQFSLYQDVEAIDRSDARLTKDFIAGILKIVDGAITKIEQEKIFGLDREDVIDVGRIIFETIKIT